MTADEVTEYEQKRAEKRTEDVRVGGDTFQLLTNWGDKPFAAASTPKYPPPLPRNSDSGHKSPAWWRGRGGGNNSRGGRRGGGPKQGKK